jgi:hypothetical protein
MAEFARGLRGVMAQAFPPLERVVLGLRSRYDVEELLALVPGLEVAEPGADATR